MTINIDRELHEALADAERIEREIDIAKDNGETLAAIRPLVCDLDRALARVRKLQAIAGRKVLP